MIHFLKLFIEFSLFIEVSKAFGLLAFYPSITHFHLYFLMFKLVLEKAEEPEIKLPTSAGSWKKQESSRKTSISALLTMPKPLTVDHNKLWKILKEMGLPDHLTCLLRNLYAGQGATELGMEQQTSSK